MTNSLNELSKLKALRDSERKSLKHLEEQRDRAIAEHNSRMMDQENMIEKTKKSIETWNNLINLLEENRAS